MRQVKDQILHERVLAVLRDAVRESDAGRVDLLDFLDGLPDCIGWTGPDSRYRFVNHAYAAWFGAPRHEIIGRTVRETNGPETYEILRPHMARALAGERTRFECTMTLRGGPPRRIVCTLVPRVDRDGQADGYLTHVEDITDGRASAVVLPIRGFGGEG